jgi:hypothetical protein
MSQPMHITHVEYAVMLQTLISQIAELRADRAACQERIARLEADINLYERDNAALRNLRLQGVTA